MNIFSKGNKIRFRRERNEGIKGEASRKQRDGVINKGLLTLRAGHGKVLQIIMSDDPTSAKLKRYNKAKINDGEEHKGQSEKRKIETDVRLAGSTHSFKWINQCCR